MEEYITIFQRLLDLADRDTAAFHMPGHKRNTSGIDFMEKLGGKYDITEIDGFDELYEPRGILKAAMDRAAGLYHSRQSFFLVNGSTVGVLAAVRAAARVSGTGKIIMARNCHRSVYNAAELCELEAIYLQPEITPGFGFCGSIQPKSVEIAARENPGTPVIITSPTYEGVISNISEISIICHMYGCPLLVDEAHGAHLNLSPHFNGGAVAGGADLVIQSVHKTLSGFTQSAILHLNGSLISEADIRRELTVFQTSSPSYLLLASLDGTFDLIYKRGGQLFNDWKRRLDRFDQRVAGIQKLKIPGHSELFECQAQTRAAGYIRRGLGSTEVYGYDRSKIVISCEGTDTTGVAMMQSLRKRFNLECEMASGGYCIAMTGLLDRDEDMDRLSSAICILDDETRKTVPRLPLMPVKIPTRRMDVHTALAEPFKDLSIREATGRISAEYIWAYPPGIPLVVPGEELAQELIAIFIIQRETGVALHSSSGGMPKTIRIIE